VKRLFKLAIASLRSNVEVFSAIVICDPDNVQISPACHANLLNPMSSLKFSPTLSAGYSSLAVPPTNKFDRQYWQPKNLPPLIFEIKIQI